MKRIALSLLAVTLLLTLVCGSAFAQVGDLTMKPTAAFSDPEMTKYIGTIPAYTSVAVRAYGNYADIVINGRQCYVKPSNLTRGNYDYDYLGYGTLKSGSKIFQRPDINSKYLTNGSNRTVLVYAIKGGLALIRSNYTGVFGFVKASNLTSLRAN